MPRARPCGRGRLCSRRARPCGRGRLRTMVRCMVRSVRVRLAPCVDHLPARVSARRSARASGARQVRWAGAHRTSRCRRNRGRRCRSDRGRRHHGRDRGAACAVRGDPAPLDSAEDRWAERMDGCCLQRETDRFAEEWERTREPGAEGRSALIASRPRTLALPRWPTSQRTEPVPTEDLARLALALHRIESADRLRIEREQAMADAAAHAGPAARAAGMTHAERVETVRRASRGSSSLGAQARRHSGGPGPAEDAPVSPPEPAPTRAVTPPRPSRLPTARRMRGRAGCVGRARGARYVGRAQGAGCRAETAGRGRPNLADRPSLLPLGVERTRVRRGAPPPLQPNTRCRRHDHANGATEKTPPPHPSPLRHSFISLKRRALAPRAWLSRLAALGGGEGERAAPSTYPLRPSGGRGTGRGGFVVCAALSRRIPLIPLNPT